MQSEAVREAAAGCQITAIDSFGSRRNRQIEKRQMRIRTVDDKFAALDERSQRTILSYVIGYLEASKDLISSGKPARKNEMSRIFETMEELINKSWNGGMI